MIRLVNQIITAAVETQASDIHIEPFEDRLRVRYRYDGLLREADSVPARLAAAITSRIKIMAKLDIAERRLPQDGRISTYFAPFMQDGGARAGGELPRVHRPVPVR